MVKGRPKGPSTNSLPKPPQLSVWAQCDNQNCQKWRRLPPGSVVEDSVPWFCYMNPDELKNSCEAPEESYNEDVEDYQLLEDPSIQISSDDDGTTAHGSWRGGAAKRGAKRKHGSASGGSRGRGRSGARQPQVKPEPQYWAPAPAPGAKRQRTSRSGDDSRVESYAAEGPPPARLQSEASLPGSAQKLPRGSAKVFKAHAAFHKLLAGAGAWEAARGRTQAVQVPPQHVWEGMAQYAPEAAELACHSLDIASAESYFARPGAASREGQQGSAQRTARLALTMAAAAAADSAAGTLHASTPQPSPPAAQGLLPVHALAAPPTGQAAALPGSSAVGHARPAALGPAQGLLGSLRMPQAMPASFGMAAAAAQHTPQAPSALQGSAAPPMRATAGQPVQRVAAMQRAPMSWAGIQPALGSQALGSHSMSSSTPVLGTELPGMAGHGEEQPKQQGGVTGAPEGLLALPQSSDIRQGSRAQSQPSTAYTAAQRTPVNPVQPHTAAVVPPALPNSGQPMLPASLGSMVRRPDSDHGAPGSHAGLLAPTSTPVQGASQHQVGASLQPAAATELGSRLQHTQQTSRRSQYASGQAHETEQSQLQKSSKHGESSLLEVQADSLGKPHPDAHGRLNGHHHGGHPRDIPNGVYEQGAVREKVSKEHEHARAEHGHTASKGRPPEVEAGYS